MHLVASVTRTLDMGVVSRCPAGNLLENRIEEHDLVSIADHSNACIVSSTK